MPGRLNDPFRYTELARLPNLELLTSYMTAADSVVWGAPEQQPQHLRTVIYLGRELVHRGLSKETLRKLCTETVVRNPSQED